LSIELRVQIDFVRATARVLDAGDAGRCSKFQPLGKGGSLLVEGGFGDVSGDEIFGTFFENPGGFSCCIFDHFAEAIEGGAFDFDDAVGADGQSRSRRVTR